MLNYSTFAELVHNTDRKTLRSLPVFINGTDPYTDSCHISGSYNKGMPGYVFLTSYDEDEDTIYLECKLIFEDEKVILVCQDKRWEF